MTVYDPFMDAQAAKPTAKPASCRSCTSCVRKPSLDLSSVISYEDGWDDHEGPQWTDPLDAKAVAQQAGLRTPKRHPSTSPRRTRRTSDESKHPPRSTLSTGKHRAPRRPSTTEAQVSSDINSRAAQSSASVPCPPDIEEIDMYMPSVEHKWFMHATPETEERFNAMRKQEDDGVEGGYARDARRRPLNSFPRKAKAKGCGYSCKLHDVRRSGLARPREAPSGMVDVGRMAW